MAENSGEEYLADLLASKDPADQALAKRIQDSLTISVVDSPLDKALPTLKPASKDVTPAPVSRGFNPS